MNLDFTTPNSQAVEWIDAYFQFHDDEKVQRTAERIAGRNYDGSYDGWDQQPQSNIRGAFYDFMSAMNSFGITEEDINNQ